MVVWMVVLDGGLLVRWHLAELGISLKWRLSGDGGAPMEKSIPYLERGTHGLSRRKNLMLRLSDLFLQRKARKISKGANRTGLCT